MSFGHEGKHTEGVDGDCLEVLQTVCSINGLQRNKMLPLNQLTPVYVLFSQKQIEEPLKVTFTGCFTQYRNH